MHSSVVTSEALSVLSKLKKPDTGFEKVVLIFEKLDAKVKETVVDQFVRHAKQLKRLFIEGSSDIPDADKVNVADLAIAILEAQEEIHMDKLALKGISSSSDDEPVTEDRRLINAMVNSGITQLTDLHLSENTSWFAHWETASYLVDFI